MEAFAKINLFLDIVGKRLDGYHDIISVMQTVSLCDEIVLQKAESGVNFFCDEGSLHKNSVPRGEDNIVVKAAKLFFDEAKESVQHEGVQIDLLKRIPIGAGLAGGSADCAATLLGMDKLFCTNMPRKKLLEMGKSLGADVPFCITGGTAFCEGIGEKITPLPPIEEGFFVIAWPGINVSTKEIFSKVTPSTIVRDYTDYKTNFFNIFTNITGGLYPRIIFLIDELKKCGAQCAEMSGTGSSVFAYFKDTHTAREALENIKTHATAFLCRPVEALQI